MASESSESIQGKHIIVSLILVLIILLGIVSARFFFFPSLSGRVTFGVDTVYTEGEPITGNLKFYVQQGELIPSDSIVKVTYGDIMKQLSLRELDGFNEREGTFYVSGSSLHGSGEGFGVPGTKTLYPEVHFELKITHSQETESTESEVVEDTETSDSGSEATQDETISETPSTEEIEATAETETSENTGTETSENTETAQEEQDSSVTGNVISTTETTVSGSVSRDGEYTYTIRDGDEVEIVSDTVTSRGVSVDSSVLSISKEGNFVTVTTDYSEEVEGFGSEFVGEDVTTLNIDLSSFGLIAKKDNSLNIALVYGDEVLADVSKDISVKVPELTAEENQTNETLNIGVEVVQYGAVLGKKVRWTKTVTLSDPSSVVIELPPNAEDASVISIDSAETESDKTVIVSSDVEKEDTEIIEVKQGEEIISSAEVAVTPEIITADGGDASEGREGVTGNVALSLELNRDPFLVILWNRLVHKWKPTGLVTDGSVEAVTVNVDQSVDSVEVEYYTDAPYAEENLINNGKEVKIVGPEDVHYENVLAYADIPESFELRSSTTLKVFWKEEGQYVPYELFDLDENGFYDYVEWIAPHLSNQTFIILITDAQHLNSTRGFISDIYEETREKDDIWSEEIPAGDYVRVTFEQNLTSVNDITIYPRVVSGTPSVSVFERDGTVELVRFDELVDNQYNKRLLTNATELNQNTFDLLIENGSVEFDHIIDPTIILNVTDTSSVTTNVTLENNFTHLSIDTSASPFNSLVGYWTFDTNTSTTTVYDYVTTNSDGTVNGDAKYTASGNYGGAEVFDGTTDYITFASTVPFVNFTKSSSFSVAVWFKTNDSGTTRNIFSDYNGTSNVGWGLIYDTSSKRVALLLRNGATQSSCSLSTTVSDNKWHFFVGAYNGTTPTCFLDGTSNAGTAYTGGEFGNDLVPAIGTFSSAVSGNAWNGTLDEIMIFNTTLSASQASDIYTNASTRFLARGEQVFNNVNVSGSLGTDNTMNLTINEFHYFSNTAFNVSVGDSISSGYYYGAEYPVSSGIVTGIPVNTPSNISIKIVYYADSNRFYTPLIVNNVTAISTNASVFDCRVLNEAGKTYNMTSDIMLSSRQGCFTVVAENIVIDGQGHVLNKSSGVIGDTYGINATGIRNLTLRNIEISKLTYGVYMTNVSSSTGSSGGNLTLINSSVDTIVNDAVGGSVAKAGGSVYLYNSSAKNISVKGGTLSLGNSVTGAGGRIYFEGHYINLTNGFYELEGGNNTGSQTKGAAGRLTINYSRGFTDYRTNYSSNLSLTLINSSGGQVFWFSNLDANGLTSISPNITLMTNYSSVNSSLLPALNRSANVTFYNMPGTFTNPFIFRDGAICFDCFNFTSLNAATVVFNVTGYSAYWIGDLPQCLAFAGCSEGANCTVSQACYMNKDTCTDGICDFSNLTISAPIYTLTDSNGNGNNLTINITNKIQFLSGNRIYFAGTTKATGGNGGTLRIYAQDLLNRSLGNLYGKGGTGTSGNGGNGGSLFLYYHGLIRSFASVDLSGGSSTGGSAGTDGTNTTTKSTTCPLDADVSGDGLIDNTDVLRIASNYNEVSGDTDFSDDYDIVCDDELNVKDLYKIGIAYSSR